MPVVSFAPWIGCVPILARRRVAKGTPEDRQDRYASVRIAFEFGRHLGDQPDGRNADQRRTHWPGLPGERRFLSVQDVVDGQEGLDRRRNQRREIPGMAVGIEAARRSGREIVKPAGAAVLDGAEHHRAEIPAGEERID
jgi:hypothetical protein